MTTRERDARAKGNTPSWVTPPKRGERCPRCHVATPPRQCALCNPPGRMTPTATQAGVPDVKGGP